MKQGEGATKKGQTRPAELERKRSEIGLRGRRVYEKKRDGGVEARYVEVSVSMEVGLQNGGKVWLCGKQPKGLVTTPLFSKVAML